MPVTRHNGATELRPGSHRFNDPRTVPVAPELAVGDVLLFDWLLLLHRTPWRREIDRDHPRSPESRLLLHRGRGNATPC